MEKMLFLFDKKKAPSGHAGGPFMNTPIMDYDKPQIYSGREQTYSSYPSYDTMDNDQKMNDYFTKGLIQGAQGLIYDKNNSQRQFYSVPVDTVPNKQSEFAQWLYGRDYVCKTGSIYDRYGYKYTPDSLACNGFNASEPTNFGRLNSEF